MDDGLRSTAIVTALHTLTAGGKKYSQLEERLAIVQRVKKFHNFLYGRQFLIKLDHQPLSYLFNETKEVPEVASSCIQRWALTLSAYQLVQNLL